MSETKQSDTADGCSSYDRDAVHLFFDVTKHITTLTVGCLGFTVYSAHALPSMLVFWVVIFLFGMSTILGLLLLLRGAGMMAVDKKYDVYERDLRISSILQITFFGSGIFLLCLFCRFPMP